MKIWPDFRTDLPSSQLAQQPWLTNMRGFAPNRGTWGSAIEHVPFLSRVASLVLSLVTVLMRMLVRMLMGL